jgi:hypothetical protein
MGSIKNAAMIALAHHLIHHPLKADGVRFAIKSTDHKPARGRAEKQGLCRGDEVAHFSSRCSAQRASSIERLASGWSVGLCS